MVFNNMNPMLIEYYTLCVTVTITSLTHHGTLINCIVAYHFFKNFLRDVEVNRVLLYICCTSMTGNLLFAAIIRICVKNRSFL